MPWPGCEVTRLATTGVLTKLLETSSPENIALTDILQLEVGDELGCDARGVGALASCPSRWPRAWARSSANNRGVV